MLHLWLFFFPFHARLFSIAAWTCKKHRGGEGISFIVPAGGWKIVNFVSPAGRERFRAKTLLLVICSKAAYKFFNSIYFIWRCWVCPLNFPIPHSYAGVTRWCLADGLFLLLQFSSHPNAKVHPLGSPFSMSTLGGIFQVMFLPFSNKSKSGSKCEGNVRRTWRFELFLLGDNLPYEPISPSFQSGFLLFLLLFVNLTTVFIYH